MIDHLYQIRSRKGEVKRTEVKISSETNDRWINAHSRVGMYMWVANMDFSLLLDKHHVVNSVAKYFAKSERDIGRYIFQLDVKLCWVKNSHR